MSFLADLKGFKKGGLSSTETRVRTADGKIFIEKKGVDGTFDSTLKGDASKTCHHHREECMHGF